MVPSEVCVRRCTESFNTFRLFEANSVVTLPRLESHLLLEPRKGFVLPRNIIVVSAFFAPHLSCIVTPLSFGELARHTSIPYPGLYYPAHGDLLGLKLQKVYARMPLQPKWAENAEAQERVSAGNLADRHTLSKSLNIDLYR